MSLALAMTYGGARGATGTQMADALNFLLDPPVLHAAFNSLEQELAGRGKIADEDKGNPFTLNVTNAIWGQLNYGFLDSYLDLLAENYGAGLRVLDFINNPEGSRDTINEWVSDQTGGRIRDLIPEGSSNALTRLVLTNAIYFNASWAMPFNINATCDGDFFLLDGSRVTAPMMQQSKRLNYAADGDYLAVELPYSGNELSMVVITSRDNFAAFEAKLGQELVDGLISRMESTNVNLTLPRFEIESEFSLKQALMKLGMETAFDSGAAFSGITGNRDLVIQDVVHKSFVTVDENGTEAAAATGVIMDIVSVPLDPVDVTFSKPFVFLIRDKQTGALLFVGRVLNPRA